MPKNQEFEIEIHPSFYSIEHLRLIHRLPTGYSDTQVLSHAAKATFGESTPVKIYPEKSTFLRAVPNIETDSVCEAS